MALGEVWKPSTPAHRLTHQDGVDLARIPDDKSFTLKALLCDRLVPPHGGGFLTLMFFPSSSL